MTLGRAVQVVQELRQHSGHEGQHSAHEGHHSSPCLAWLLAPRAKAGVRLECLGCLGLLCPPVLAREGQIQLLEFPKPRHESQGLLLGVSLIGNTISSRSAAFILLGAAREIGAIQLWMKLPFSPCFAVREKCSSEIILFFLFFFLHLKHFL